MRWKEPIWKKIIRAIVSMILATVIYIIANNKI
jgi:hypothetical protein